MTLFPRLATGPSPAPWPLRCRSFSSPLRRFSIQRNHTMPASIIWSIRNSYGWVDTMPHAGPGLNRPATNSSRQCSPRVIIISLSLPAIRRKIIPTLSVPPICFRTALRSCTACVCRAMPLTTTMAGSTLAGATRTPPPTAPAPTTVYPIVRPRNI